MQSAAFGKGFTVQFNKYKYLFLLLLPALALIAVFSYVPMYGVIIAFKDYKLMKGIGGSDWIGLTHFRSLFSSPSFMEVLRNTILISLYRLVFGFPAPIVLALLLNEMMDGKFKKITQTISYLPHFMSWVVIGGILVQVLSPERGVINYVIKALGGQAIYFLAEPSWFRTIVVTTGIWQGIGWGSVIYLASLSGIDPQMYEAARIDGANRFQQAVRISIPMMMPVITVLLILAVGNILNAGFDQIFNLYNPLVYSTGDIIDTYIYRRGLIENSYGFATAAGLFKNVIGFFLVIGTNILSKKFSEYGVW